MATRTVGTQTTASPDVAHREKRKSRSCDCESTLQPAKKTRFTHPGDTSSPPSSSSASVPNDQTPQTSELKTDEKTPWWMKRTEQEEEEFRRVREERATLNRKIEEQSKISAQLSLKVQQCLKESDVLIRESQKERRITRKIIRRNRIFMDKCTAEFNQILREGNRAIYEALFGTEEVTSTESNELHSSVDQDGE